MNTCMNECYRKRTETGAYPSRRAQALDCQRRVRATISGRLAHRAKPQQSSPHQPRLARHHALKNGPEDELEIKYNLIECLRWLCMSHVVPSQIDLYIQEVFHFVRAGSGAGTPAVVREQAGQVAGLIELIDRIPDELITLTGRDYNEFVGSVASLRQRVLFWQNQQDLRINSAMGALFRSQNPITTIHELILKCPDESPSPTTSELLFITDAALRDDLRVDIAVIGRALSNSEWKAVTVLSGAVIEALLLWRLQQCEPVEIGTVSSEFPKLPNKDLQEWHLPDYITAAERLKILDESVIKQVQIAKDFRNLIHPGRSQRLSRKCDRATALSAVAAMEHVVTALAPRKL
jgi:hypothetical protein